jgi:hypothetical protein
MNSKHCWVENFAQYYLQNGLEHLSRAVNGRHAYVCVDKGIVFYDEVLS